MKNTGWTAKQLSKYFFISEGIIYQWCEDGKVKHEKVRGKMRIDLSSVKKMFDNMPGERYIPTERQALYQIPDDSGNFFGYDYIYFVTSDSKVINFSTRKVLSQRVCDDGYVRVWLMEEGKRVSKMVHCLVYKTQGDNVLHKRHIHHINGNKADNRIQNLIAVTSAQHGELHRLLNAGKTDEYKALIRKIRKENRQKLYSVLYKDGLELHVTKEAFDLYKKGMVPKELYRKLVRENAFRRVYSPNEKRTK